MIRSFFEVARKWISRNEYPTTVNFTIISASSDAICDIEYVR